MEEIAVREGCSGAHRSIAAISGGAMIVGSFRDSVFNTSSGDVLLLERGSRDT